MAKTPRLTKDVKFHDKTPEQVFNLHHARNAEGEPLPGAAEEHAGDGCECAHCETHVQGDPQILENAKKVFAAEQAKRGKQPRVFTQEEVDALVAQAKQSVATTSQTPPPTA